MSAHALSYAKNRTFYEDFSAVIHRIAQEVLKFNCIKTHSIEYRAKDVASFERKSNKKNEDGSNKYKNPLLEITDLAACRIIVFTTNDVKYVCDLIKTTFDIKQEYDLGEIRSETADFGYKSVHFLVSLDKERCRLNDFKKFTGFICEIQVRTILQHAWAEMEHDIQYKGVHDVPKQLKHKFRALAGLIEIADREFTAIQEEDNKLKQAIHNSVSNDINAHALVAIETEYTGSSGSSKNISAPIKALNRVRELIANGKYDEAIKAFDENIKQTPKAHTQYLGRAKIKFLLGDTSGALRDIGYARELKPDDKALDQITKQISDGVSINFNEDIKNATKEFQSGMDYMKNGKGEIAFVCFQKAIDGGYNYAIASFCLAASCAVLLDHVGTRIYLSRLRKLSGTPMEINMGLTSIRCDFYTLTHFRRVLKRLLAGLWLKRHSHSFRKR
jgi:ppGpp synthetase/RelA/SpoT-type nucleotidyltranferase